MEFCVAALPLLFMLFSYSLFPFSFDVFHGFLCFLAVFISLSHTENLDYIAANSQLHDASIPTPSRIPGFSMA